MRFIGRTLLAIAVGALLAAGCGDDDPAGSSAAVDDLTRALDRAVSSSARTEFFMRADTHDEGRFTFRASMLTAEGSETGRLRGVLKAEGESFSFRMIMHEDEAWFRSAGLDSTLPDGKRWVRSTDPELFSQTLTPAQFGELLRAVGSVEDLGRSRIRGTSVKQLHAEMDVADLLDRLDGELATRFERLGSGAQMEMELDVWVPPGGRPLRYRIRVDTPQRPGGGPPQFAEIDLDVLEYDVAVDTAPPPPEQVIEEDEAGL